MTRAERFRLELVCSPLFLTVPLFLCGVTSAQSPSVLITADTQGCVAAEPGGQGGLERRATLIKSLRTDESKLLIDAGNAFFGASATRSDGDVMAASYDALQYDIVNISYRDFRLGKAATLELLSDVQFTPVSANLIDAETNELLFAPYVVKESGNLSVAFLGVTQRPAGLDFLPKLKKQFEGLRIVPPLQAIHTWLPKARDEADRVILVYYGSLLELGQIRNKLDDSGDVIVVGGIRPTQLPKADTSQTPVAAVADRGQEVAMLSLMGETVSIRHESINAHLAADQTMTNLLSTFVTPDELIGDPLVGSVIESDVPHDLPESYTRMAEGMSGIELRGPWYQGDPADDPPEHWKAGKEMWHGSHGGRFQSLLRKFKVENDGENRVNGFSETTSYRGHENIPQGYWVYVAPDWYVWKEDLAPQAPYYWRIRDINTGEVITYSGKKWNTLPVPPGSYRITVQSWYGEELVWKERFEVQPDQIRTLVLRTGISVRSEEPEGLSTFMVYDPRTSQLVARPLKSFAPIHPGTYHLKVGSPIGEDYIDWGNVKVDKNRVTSVKLSNGLKLVDASGKHKLYWFHIRNRRTGELAVIAQSQGVVPLRAGSYSLGLLLSGADKRMLWRNVEVKQGEFARITVDSGVELIKPENEPERLDAWSIYDAKTEKRVLHITSFKYWGFAPLPPGDYYATAYIDFQHGLPSKPFRIQAGSILPLTFEDLGFALIECQTPAGAGVFIALPSTDGPGTTIGYKTVKGEQDSLMRKDGMQSTEPSFVRWTPHAGQCLLRYDCRTNVPGFKSFTLEKPVELQAGKLTGIPFDAEDFAKRYDLILTQIDWGSIDPDSDEERVVVFMDAAGENDLGYRKNPPPDMKFLAPKGALVRVRQGPKRAIIRDLPPGQLSRIDFEAVLRAERPVSQKTFVDVVIESPQEGAIVTGKTVRVVGQASTSRPAGATRIAIVMDTSGSVLEPSGDDLDGDDKEETVLDAQVMASKLLVEKLHELDQRNPGTAFQVSVIRFSLDPEVMSPLLPLSDPSSQKTIQAALDRIQKEGDQGGTSFIVGLQAAMAEFQAAEKPAPSVILFISDGEGAARQYAASIGFQGVAIHAIGLGNNFREPLPGLETVVLPRNVSSPYLEMADFAAVGGPGGGMWAIPKPADIVKVLPKLPVTELPEADIKEIRVVNSTTGVAAENVRIDRNGFFEADVPVNLVPDGTHELNRIVVTAVARDGESYDTDEVSVRGVLPWAHLQIVRSEDDSPPVTPAIEFVLDSSGSMLDRIDGKPKYLIARDVLLKLLYDLPDQAQVGLRLFGHMGFASPRAQRSGAVIQNDPRLNTDTQLVVGIGPYEGQRSDQIRRQISAVVPRGKTPLVYSLLKAKEDFADATDAARLVILVSDGKENCGGKLEDVAREYRDTGIEYTIHVVGFDINDSIARRKLQRIAQYGAGEYHDAKSASELSKVLKKTLATTGYVVLDKAGRPVARGVINGSAVEIKPGDYRIRIKGASETTSLNLKNNQRMTLQIDSDGKLTRVEYSPEQN